MKRIFYLAVAGALLFSSCSKSTVNNNNNPNTSSSILPLKTGNSWVYQDSVFNTSSVLTEAYPDSTFINGQTTAVNGVIFYGITDSIGWFGTGGYVAVDPSNTLLYGKDSLNGGSYLFFGIGAYDNYLLGSSSDFSNPSCVGFDALYGFATTYTINGFSCYRSYEYIKDCNNNIITAYVYYVSPGIGIVRIEDYEAIPSSGTNNLYMDFSQTLKSYKVN